MMRVAGRRVLLCSCEGTMKPDGAALARALGTEAPDRVFHHLCRSQLAEYRAALAAGEPLLVACAQEAPLFTELAEEAGVEPPVFADIRDRAGWSSEAAAAQPKMAALMAEAALELEPTATVPLDSAGRILVLGRDEAALEVASRLAAERSVTCVLAPPATGLIPPMARGFALFRGKARAALGGLGGFSVAFEALEPASVSSRRALEFDRGGEGSLPADVVLDLTGGTALMGERDGYLKVDPGAPAAVERALLDAKDLYGEFEKPRYVRVDTALCAHSRNLKVACTRCLDTCPSGAIQPAGEHVAVDAKVCSGHGGCASACPTGAISYQVPAANGVYKRLAALVQTYRAGGAERPVLLVHDTGHGDRLISAAARFGDGLPARVLPLGVHAVAALGPDFLLTALAYGAARVLVLADPSRRLDLAPLNAAAGLANRVAAALGHGGRVEVLAEADPHALADALAGTAPEPAPAAEFLVLGGKRQTLSLALSHLHRTASTKVDVIALEPGDPFGQVVVDAAKCTLCLACVPVCPTGALSGHAEKPSLGFVEANCVQCGLCRATCPETAITLSPRLSFLAESRTRVVQKEEEPWLCPCCGKPFGTRSSIEKLVERLKDHSMFAGTGRLELIKMCEDCRVVAQVRSEDGQRPMAAGERPTKTTDDYLREREKGKP